MKWSQAALLEWSEPHLFGPGLGWCAFNSLRTQKLEGRHNAVFSDRWEHFQQIQTFVPSLQGPYSSPVTPRGAMWTWQLFPDRYNSYILTRLCNCNWKGKFLPFFHKNEKPPTLQLCFRRFHSSFRFAKFGANGRVWLTWAAICHRLLPGQVEFLQPLLLEGGRAIPTHMSAGG